MTWTKPDFVEISLAMEVTGYVNTDDAVESPPGSTPAAPPTLPQSRARARGWNWPLSGVLRHLTLRSEEPQRHSK